MSFLAQPPSRARSGASRLQAPLASTGPLQRSATYYWRIDAVDSSGNALKGPVWSFTTADFLIVEDFEDYTNNDAAGEAVWETWIDGVGTTTNASQVGYLMPPHP